MRKSEITHFNNIFNEICYLRQSEIAVSTDGTLQSSRPHLWLS